MNKVKIFIGDVDAVREYRDFLESNPLIEIVSVNTLGKHIIFLTYR